MLKDISNRSGFMARIHNALDMALKGIKFLFLALIRFYRAYLSPLKPPVCRYIPTCSEYAMIAIEKYGPIKGGWMAIKRILRCHPFHTGGYDPVK